MRVFSRNCEDRTQSYPDVADIVRDAAAGGRSLLLWQITPLLTGLAMDETKNF